jgi:recombination protein U
MRHGQRGKQLEQLVDMANRQYRNKGMADVRKIPTPFQITGNGRRRGEMIGRKQKGELVDYMGIADGKAIIFDAKETAVTTRFDLDNLHAHQFEILKSWHEKGARAFLLVSFTKRQGETYILPFELLNEAWTGYIGDGAKSIPYSVFFEKCEQVKSEKGFVLHYLKGAIA